MFYFGQNGSLCTDGTITIIVEKEEEKSERWTLRDTGNRINASSFNTDMRDTDVFSVPTVRDVIVTSKRDLFSQLVGNRQVGLQKLLLVILYFQEAACQAKEKPKCKYFWWFYFHILPFGSHLTLSWMHSWCAVSCNGPLFHLLTAF